MILNNRVFAGTAIQPLTSRLLGTLLHRAALATTLIAGLGLSHCIRGDQKAFDEEELAFLQTLAQIINSQAPYEYRYYNNACALVPNVAVDSSDPKSVLLTKEEHAPSDKGINAAAINNRYTFAGNSDVFEITSSGASGSGYKFRLAFYNGSALLGVTGNMTTGNTDVIDLGALLGNQSNRNITDIKVWTPIATQLDPSPDQADGVTLTEVRRKKYTASQINNEGLDPANLDPLLKTRRIRLVFNSSTARFEIDRSQSSKSPATFTNSNQRFFLYFKKPSNPAAYQFRVTLETDQGNYVSVNLPLNGLSSMPNISFIELSAATMGFPVGTEIYKIKIESYASAGASLEYLESFIGELVAGPSITRTGAKFHLAQTEAGSDVVVESPDGTMSIEFSDYSGLTASEDHAFTVYSQVANQLNESDPSGSLNIKLGEWRSALFNIDPNSPQAGTDRSFYTGLIDQTVQPCDLEFTGPATRPSTHPDNVNSPHANPNEVATPINSLRPPV